MADLEAIRARHQPAQRLKGPGIGRDYCPRDRQDWPCDVIVVLAALDAERQRADRLAAAINAASSMLLSPATVLDLAALDAALARFREMEP
jgi:hypothetical protein